MDAAPVGLARRRRIADIVAGCVEFRYSVRCVSQVGMVVLQMYSDVT